MLPSSSNCCDTKHSRVTLVSTHQVCCASTTRVDGNPLVMESVSSRHSGKAVADSAGCYIPIRGELLWVVVPAKKTLLLLCAGSKRDWTPIEYAKRKEAQNL